MQRLAEQPRVPRLLRGRVDAAGDPVRDVRERRLQFEALLARQHALFAAAEPRLQLHLAPRALHRRPVRLHDELARGRPVEVERLARDEVAQQVAREVGEQQQAARRLPGRRRVAGAHEGEQPAPLVRVGLGAEVQRPLGIEQPERHLAEHARPGEGCDVGVGELAAIGEGGAAAGPGLGVHHGDFVPFAGEEVGGGQADDAGAEDEDAHGGAVSLRGAGGARARRRRRARGRPSPPPPTGSPRPADRRRGEVGCRGL